MREVAFLQQLHKSTQRNYLERMNGNKAGCMSVAKDYGFYYWDGNRCFGFGGYRYDGRWASVAKSMIEYYGLKSGDKVLDIGCGKGHLMYEMSQLGCKVSGVDKSAYAYEQGKIPMLVGCCTKIPLEGKYDLTVSINAFHNLSYRDLKLAIKEMVRLSGGKMYICVESYRNEQELCNLQCWALTCQSFYSPDDWKEILTDNRYDGEIEFVFFE